CGFSMNELEPRMFSFNSPFGACPECDGLGFKMIVDPELIVDPHRTIDEGAFEPWAGSTSTYYPQFLQAVCRHYGIPTDVPVGELADEQMRILLYGTNGEKIHFRYENDFGHTRDATVPFEGIVRNLERRYRETPSDGIREFIEQYMSTKPCEACKGKRLKPEVLAVTVGGQSIDRVTDLSIGEAQAFFRGLQLTEKEKAIAGLILKEIENRLG